jgi:hypothetical protein
VGGFGEGEGCDGRGRGRRKRREKEQSKKKTPEKRKSGRIEDLAVLFLLISATDGLLLGPETRAKPVVIVNSRARQYLEDGDGNGMAVAVAVATVVDDDVSETIKSKSRYPFQEARER